jgi:ABC-type dipeptide/oligopeptide/nickel transport system permease component
MIRYVMRRFVQAIVTLVVVSLVLFLVMKLYGGDPGWIMLGHFATPAKVHALDQALGVLQPWPVQHDRWPPRSASASRAAWSKREGRMPTVRHRRKAAGINTSDYVSGDSAIYYRLFGLLVNTVLVIGVITIPTNLVVDILTAVADPRVRFG